jgi:hypothetical protein
MEVLDGVLALYPELKPRFQAQALRGAPFDPAAVGFPTPQPQPTAQAGAGGVGGNSAWGSPPPPAPAQPAQAPQGGAGGLPRALGRNPADLYRQAGTLREQALTSAMPSPEARQAALGSANEGALAGMAMQALGGKAFAPIGGQMLQQALKRRSEVELDPMKEAEFGAKRLEAQAAALENEAKVALTVEEQRQKREDAAEARREAQEMRRLQFEALQEQRRATNSFAAQAAADRRAAADERRAAREEGQVQIVTDPATGETRLVNKRTGESRPVREAGAAGGAAAPGQQYPDQPSNKATQDERQSAMNVKRIVNSARLMNPDAAAPGFFEAAAGTLPGNAGDAAASAVRGMSGDRQTTFQSQSDIVDALLWLSTGAAYNKEQLQMAREAYMPKFTDNEGAKQAKRERLKGMIESARTRAGRAWTQEAEDALKGAFPDLYGEAPAAAPAPKPRGGLNKAGAAARADAYLKE